MARIDIPRGAVISDTETYLTTEPIGQDTYDSNPENYLRSVDDARGLLAVNSISRGTTLRQADLTEPGLAQSMPTAEADQPRPKAFPIQVNNLSGVADLIQQGDSVDVLISFRVAVSGLGAGLTLDPTSQLPVLVPVEREFADQRTTKTLVQNVEVLRIVRQQTQVASVEGEPTVTPEITGEGGGSEDVSAPVEGSEVPPPTSWTLVLAVTDQEAELIKFAQEEGQRLVLVLRGSGDRDEEETTGVTLDLLINEYGVPLPNPFNSNQSQPLTPVPTTAPTP